MGLLLLSLISQDPCVAFNSKTNIVTREDTRQPYVLCEIGGERVALETLEKEVAGTKTEVIDHFLSTETRQIFTDAGGWVIQPAAGYCVNQLKGTWIRAYYEDGSQGGLCKMKDDSIISDWTMYRGKTHARNPDLYELIKKLRQLP